MTRRSWRITPTSFVIATRQPKKYDEAVQLLRDLLDLADQDARSSTALARITGMRETHSNKPSLLRRMHEAQL